MLDIVEVTKQFGSVTAARSISLDLRDGTTFGLLGPNGAGKTTLMRMIVGIIAPDSGTISWNGTRVEERMRRRFGYLPEERGLYGRMRVRDHIEYLGRLRGLRAQNARQVCDEWIERLALTEYAQRPCSELSKGNQQKVQFACAVVHRPDLLILDEPFTGLDPVNAGILRDLLVEMKRTGATLVLSSHEMFALESLCDEFCIIDRGTLRSRGTLAQLRKGWPVRRVRIAPNTTAVRALVASDAGARIVENDDAAVTYDLAPETDCALLLRRLVDAEPISQFEQIEPSLQEVYLRSLDQGVRGDSA
ncbi:MAG: ABC transporter ATP-binding protein [Candidatus Tyrphobacter sp.]